MGFIVSDFAPGAKRIHFSRKKILHFGGRRLILSGGGRMLGIPPLGLKPVPHHQV
jgi:hypothetical protein